MTFALLLIFALAREPQPEAIRDQGSVVWCLKPGNTESLAGPPAGRRTKTERTNEPMLAPTARCSEWPYLRIQRTTPLLEYAKSGQSGAQGSAVDLAQSTRDTAPQEGTVCSDGWL